MARPRRTNSEIREATRTALLEIASRHFAEQGYAATATEAIVREAGVTRGALYYHFADKRALFEAVFLEAEARILAAIEAATSGLDDPAAALRAGMRAFVTACAEPALRRIVLLDGPSVLGWATWRAVDRRFGFGTLIAGLEAAVAAGLLPDRPVRPLAHLLSGAANEAAFAAAEGGPEAAAALLDALDRLVAAVLRPDREVAGQMDGQEGGAG